MIPEGTGAGLPRRRSRNLKVGCYPAICREAQAFDQFLVHDQTVCARSQGFRKRFQTEWMCECDFSLCGSFDHVDHRFPLRHNRRICSRLLQLCADQDVNDQRDTGRRQDVASQSREMIFRRLVKYGRHGVLLCRGQGIQPLNSSARNMAAGVITVDLFLFFSNETISVVWRCLSKASVFVCRALASRRRGCGDCLYGE